MKTTTTFLGQLLIILLLSFAAKGQILEYKELKEFHQDTIAYIEYTFTTSNHFLHCTMDDIFSQCEIPFKSYMLARTTRNGIGFCILFFQDAEKVRASLQARQANPLGAYTAIFQEYITTTYFPPSIKNCQNSRQIKSWTWTKLQRTY